MLEALRQWWNQGNKDCWAIEQVEISVILSDLMLLDHVSRQLIVLKGSYNFESLLYVWDKYRPKLIPYRSPLISSLPHPELQEAIQMLTSLHGSKVMYAHFYLLKFGSGIDSFQQLIHKTACLVGHEYQY